MKKLLLVFVTAVVLGQAAFTQESIVPPPEIIGRGFDALQKDGVQAALNAWMKGSPLENDSNGRLQVSGGLNTIQSAYGRFIGWDKVRVVQLGHAVLRVYVVAKFERGPLFVSFDCYRAGAEWIIPMMDMHTKASNVFPPAILSGQ